VPGVHILALAEQRDDPAREHLILPGPHAGAFAVEREAGQDHEDDAPDEEHVHHQGRQRVVACVFQRLADDHGVPLNLVEQLAPEASPPDGRQENLLGVFVANESPVDPEQEGHRQDVACCKMQITDPAEEEAGRSFSSDRRRWRADKVTGDPENENAKGIDPMPDPDWCLVDIDGLFLVGGGPVIQRFAGFGNLLAGCVDGHGILLIRRAAPHRWHRGRDRAHNDR